MKPDTELTAGEIVQLNPIETKNKAFAGCFMVVTEPKPFGAQGYVQSLGKTRGQPGEQAYYLATWEEISKTGGFAEWVVA